nr:uncharacterized protein LOC113824810 [Penaeus vannamei]
MELGKDVHEEEEEEAKEGLVGVGGGILAKEAKDGDTPKDCSAADTNDEKETNDGMSVDCESGMWEGIRMDIDAEEFIILDEMIETDVVEESESNPPMSWEANGSQSPKAGGGEDQREEGNSGKSPTRCEKETVTERDRSSEVNVSTTGTEGIPGCGENQSPSEGHGSESPKESEALCRSKGKEDSKEGISEVTTLTGLQREERTPSRSDIVLENCEGTREGGFVNTNISKGETDKVKISHAEESSALQDGISDQVSVSANKEEEGSEMLHTSGLPDSKPDDADEKPATEESQNVALSCQTKGTATLFQPTSNNKSEEKDALQECVVGETTLEGVEAKGAGECAEEKNQSKEQNKNHDRKDEKESKDGQEKKDSNQKPKEQTERPENNANESLSQVVRAKCKSSGNAKDSLDAKAPQQTPLAVTNRVKVQGSGKPQSGQQKGGEEWNKNLKNKGKAVGKKQGTGNWTKLMSHKNSKEENKGAAKSNNNSTSSGKATEAATVKKEAVTSKDIASKKKQAQANREESKNKPTKGSNIKNINSKNNNNNSKNNNSKNINSKNINSKNINNKNTNNKNTSKSNKEKKVPASKREREEVEDPKSRKRPRKENIAERGIEDEEFQKFLETSKEAMASSRRFSRVIIVGDSRIELLDKLWVLEDKHMKVDIVSRPFLCLNELQKLIEDLISLAPQQETLILCSLGIYEIIDFEDYKPCKEAGGHEAVKNITMKIKLYEVDEVCKAHNNLLKQMKLVKKALESSSGNVRVTFTSILPVSLGSFREVQVKAHKSNGQHELDSEYMANSEVQSMDICQFLFSFNRLILNGVNVDYTKQKIEWNLLKSQIFPNPTTIEKHLGDGLNPSVEAVKALMVPHLRDIILKHSQARYHKIVLLQDWRINDLEKWTSDFTYLNFKVMAKEEGSIKLSCPGSLPELPVFKQSLIVISFGLYDLVKLTGNPEAKVEFLFKGRSTEEVSKEMLDNMRNFKDQLKKHYEGCDVVFATICHVDLLSYLEENSEPSKEGKSQESISGSSEELSKLRDVINEVNKAIRVESQAKKLPLWDFCNIVCGSSEDEVSKPPKRIPKSILYDGVHLTRNSVLRIMEACLAYSTVLSIQNIDSQKAKKAGVPPTRSQSPLFQKGDKRSGFHRQVSPESKRETRREDEDRSFRFRSNNSSGRRPFTEDKSMSPFHEHVGVRAAARQFRRSVMGILEMKDSYRSRGSRDRSPSPIGDPSRYRPRSGHTHSYAHTRFGERDRRSPEISSSFSRRPASPRRDGWRPSFSQFPLNRDRSRGGRRRSTTPPEQWAQRSEERSHSPHRRRRSPVADQRDTRTQQVPWNHRSRGF